MNTKNLFQTIKQTSIKFDFNKVSQNKLNRPKLFPGTENSDDDFTDGDFVKNVHIFVLNIWSKSQIGQAKLKTVRIKSSIN